MADTSIPSSAPPNLIVNPEPIPEIKPPKTAPKIYEEIKYSPLTVGSISAGIKNLCNTYKNIE